jgi:hypothetical protein
MNLVLFTDLMSELTVRQQMATEEHLAQRLKDNIWSPFPVSPFYACLTASCYERWNV